MDELVAAAIGVLLGLLVLVAGVWIGNRLDTRQKQQKQDMRKARLANYDSGGELASAYAASDLVPWVLGMDGLSGGRIQVLGGDGTYINQEKGAVWSDGLDAWLKEGLNVDYILLEIDEHTHAQYTRLSKELNGRHEARFRVIVAREPSGGYPKDVKGTEEDLHTCHPTLLYGSDNSGRAMWIEGDHQPNSEYAYDVRYVPPKAMNDEWQREFMHYESQIEKIKSYCVDLETVTV